MTDEKKLSLSGRGTLGVGKGADSGKVRQSFSHGRSKSVVVEVKRKRVLKKGGAGAPGEQEAPKPEAKDFKPKKAKESAPGALSVAERDARERALQEARKREEEEALRRQQEDERRKAAAEEAKRKAAEEEALRLASAEAKEQEAGAEGTAAADAEAKRLAEEAARKAADEKARKKKEAEERKAAEEAARLQTEQEVAKAREAKPKTAAEKPATKAAERRRGEEEEEARRKRNAGRVRGDERRRSGKLSVNRDFDDDGRQRSLASWKRAQAKRRGAPSPGGQQPQQRQNREVVIPEILTVQELANRMAEKAPAVIKALMKLGIMATINENIDQDTAELIVAEFGHTAKRVAESDVEIGLVGEEDDPRDQKPRAPIVTVMGHVDHGKTSLLDALRSADVVSGEAGGITQHIGAYQIQTDDGHKITFLDTPGHEAFTQMRSRGAGVTDIVILVVAADDGIMPQTIEAINHAKAAEVPIIVAINKIDKQGADPSRVRNELLQQDIQVESMGGEVLDIEVSALKKTNLDKLQEAIMLQAELMELKANPDRAAEGSVIEAQLDKGRGPVATVLVSRGTLNVGDIFVAGAEWGRVRALINDRGDRVDSAGPAQPVEVLGLNGTPSAGDEFSVVENEARAREVSSYRQGQEKKRLSGGVPTTLEGMFASMRERQADSLPIILKADVQGSAEAIVQALEKLGNEDIKARLLHVAVGGITETDITLASASEALVIGFNVRANKQAREAAERDGVGIQYYSVIYDLVDDVKAAMEGRLEPEIRENTLGLVDVLEVFNAGKAGKAAGCLVTEGVARAGAKVRVLRDDVVVYKGQIASLRRFKDDVKEVKSGMECGMTFENFVDVNKGDQIEVYEEESVKREL